MKKLSIKILVVILVVGILAGGFKFYSIYSSAQSAKEQAAAILIDYEILREEHLLFEKQQSVLSKEQRRCLEFTRQESGDFNEFQYCNKYLDLTEDLLLEDY